MEGHAGFMRTAGPMRMSNIQERKERKKLKKKHLEWFCLFRLALRRKVWETKRQDGRGRVGGVSGEKGWSIGAVENSAKQGEEYVTGRVGEYSGNS